MGEGSEENDGGKEEQKSLPTTMAGKASNPMRVTTAPTIPLAVENTAQVISAAMAMDPGRFRAAICSA